MERPSAHLSVIIPAYNEERRLPSTLSEVVRYLAAQPYASEVIVVDDGSADGTPGIVRSFADAAVPVRLAGHPDGLNHGKGASVQRGMELAAGKFRLFMDADNSTSVDQVERFWPALEEGCQVVIGSRKAPGARIAVRQPWYKDCAGRIGNCFIRWAAVPGIRDTQAGFKLFTAACAEDLFPRLTIRRWGYDVELLAMARVRGYRIREMPITWINSPDSKVSSSAYLQVLAEVWRVRSNRRRGLYRN